MYFSFFDVFSIGIGPSSSHTMGPMRAATCFVESLTSTQMEQTARVQTTLYGSLALTGVGHGTPNAVIYGLMGINPETMDMETDYIKQVKDTGNLLLNRLKPIDFRIETDIILNKEVFLPEHANGLTFCAMDDKGQVVREETYFSIGGGTVVRRDDFGQKQLVGVEDVLHPFSTCAELIAACQASNLSIADLVYQNEIALHSIGDLDKRLQLIEKIMDTCIEKGIDTEGELPGGLGIRRRASTIYRRLEEKFHDNDVDPLMIIDWINLWAFAAAEENAAGGRVVTAPTMGSAGVIPAVLRYYERFASRNSPFEKSIGKRTFLLTASAICSLYRNNASISGAEVGCQGEVGVACSMAAAGLAAAMGGTLQQIENAAEIAMEHNLGLTCDPVCGLVQVPCIERNAIAAVKAVNAARLAIRGNGTHLISLDNVIATMYETGKNLAMQYKETSLGGLALHAC